MTRSVLPHGLAGLLLLAHGALAWAVRTPAMLTGQDDAAYYLLSRSLRAFRYEDVWIVGHPAHIQYPPGYPALLTLLRSLIGDRYDGYLAFNVICTVGALAIVYLVVARLWGPAIAVLCLAAVALNPYLILMPGELRPEASFSLFTAAALGLTLVERGGTWVLLLTGLSAVLAAMTRAPGIVVPAAIGLHWMLQRRFAAASVLAAVTALTAGAWVAWVLLAPAQFLGSSYGADLARSTVAGDSSPMFELAARIWRNAVAYGSDVLPRHFVLPAVAGTPADNVVTTAVVVIGLAFGCVAFLRRWRPAGLLLLGYGGLLSIWVWQAGRYFFPFLPLLAAAVVIGIGLAAGRLRRSFAMSAMCVLGVTMLIHGAVDTSAVVRAVRRCKQDVPAPIQSSCLSAEQRGFFAALDFIREHTPPDAVVFTAKPEPAFLYGARLTVRRAPMLDALQREPAASMASFRDAGVTHVLLAHLAAIDLGMLGELARRCALLVPVASFGERTIVLGIPEPGVAPGTGACEALDRHRTAIRDPATGKLDPFQYSWPPNWR